MRWPNSGVEMSDAFWSLQKCPVCDGNATHEIGTITVRGCTACNNVGFLKMDNHSFEFSKVSLKEPTKGTSY